MVKTIDIVMNTSKDDKSTLSREGESFRFRGEEIISVITDYRVLQMFHICSQDVFLLLIMTKLRIFMQICIPTRTTTELKPERKFGSSSSKR